MLIFASSTKPASVACPECNAPMTLARITPRLGGMAELHSFECKACRAVLTQAADDRPGAEAYRGLLAKAGNIGG
jgi:hypothetical protein